MTRAVVLMEQLAWYASEDESVLGVLVVDTDEEFSGVILARDLRERFRWVNQKLGTYMHFLKDACICAALVQIN